MKPLLDTHTLIWWLEGAGRLPPVHAEIIDDAVAGEGTLYLSAISLWEVAMLHDLGRIRLSRPLREWLDYASAGPIVRLCAITSAVASASAGLPPGFHRDPADRLIVGTAQVHGCELLTSDRRIIDANVVATR